MKDIRIHISFPTHRKTKRLIKTLGHEAPLCLLRLWCYAAQHRTDGLLKDLDNFDIADEAGWSGEPEDFIQALLDVKYLDDTPKGLKLHDWGQHQPFIATHSKRSQQASEAAKKRWEKEKENQDVVCGSHKSALRIDEKRNAPYPSPSPLPSPNPKKTLMPEAYRLSDLLIERILLNKPDFRELQPDRRSRSRERYADDVDKMLRLDSREAVEVEKIIKWATADSFWKSNILSGATLRKQYDKLSMARQRAEDAPQSFKDPLSEFSYRRKAE